MAEHTEISWADSTLNIWAGCTKVSTGPKGACEGCYAENLMDNRMGVALWGNHPRVQMKHWRKQLRKIAKLAVEHFAKTGQPWFVFVNSLSDFWDNQADPAWRREALTEFAKVEHVVFLLLTKRPQNIVKLFAAIAEVGEAWPRNCAIGCTVVTQAEADRDIPFLLAAKAALDPAFAFLSLEPLMEMVDVGAVVRRLLLAGAPMGDGPRPIDWMITGGGTDQGKWRAPPSQPDWFRSIRDQCASAGVAYQHKQNGEWALIGTTGPHGRVRYDCDSGMARVGKKVSERLLDGVTHDARPAVRI